MRAVAAHLRANGADEAALARWARAIDVFARDPGGLTGHGEREMFKLGERFRERYAPALADTRVGLVGKAGVRVRSSFKPRAQASAEAFVQGYAAVERIEVDGDDGEDVAKWAARAVPPCRPGFGLDHHNRSTTSIDVSSVMSEAEAEAAAVAAVAAVPDPTSSSPVTSDSDDNEIDDSVSLLSSPSDSASSLPSSPLSSEDDYEEEREQPPRFLSMPYVQVLGQGDDASLRFFEHHQAYAAFARSHKVEQRSRMAAPKRHAPGSAHDCLAARLATVFGAPKACLAPEHIRVVAEAAAFDIAHATPDSIFADVLTSRDIRYLEGFEHRYRPFFKGHQRFGAVTAPLVQDLMDSLTAVVDSVKAGMPYVAADLRFAHAETLVPFLLLLGIESATGPRPKKSSKKTRATGATGLSALSPFAANLAVELYGPDGASPEGQFRVRFRLHERYITAVPALGPNCTSADGYIDLPVLLDFFHAVLDLAAQSPSC
jgi:Histidine phosphatase superfamily (branch 2)